VPAHNYILPEHVNSAATVTDFAFGPELVPGRMAGLVGPKSASQKLALADWGYLRTVSHGIIQQSQDGIKCPRLPKAPWSSLRVFSKWT